MKYFLIMFRLKQRREEKTLSKRNFYAYRCELILSNNIFQKPPSSFCRMLLAKMKEYPNDVHDEFVAVRKYVSAGTISFMNYYVSAIINLSVFQPFHVMKMFIFHAVLVTGRNKQNFAVRRCALCTCVPCWTVKSWLCAKVARITSKSVFRVSDTTWIDERKKLSKPQRQCQYEGSKKTFF